MGNCFCVKKELSSQNDLPCDSENRKSANEDETNEDSNDFFIHVDLSKQILYKMANKVIDVSGYDFSNLDTKELEERQKIYSTKLNELKSPLIKEPNPKVSKLIDIKHLLSRGRIDQNDCNLIENTTQNSLKAVQDNFKVTNDQDLVVNFEY